MDKKTIVIIMAGGLGKRMNSTIPKVLHKIGDLPMLCHVVMEAKKISPDKIIIVVGRYKDIIISTLSEYTSLNNIIFINQSEPLGTGHAIMCCRDYLMQFTNTNANTKVLILSGDVPLITSQTLQDMLDCNYAKIITTILDNPHGYGRIFEINNEFQKIIEEKDCTEHERSIKKVNCGIYAFDNSILCKYLPHIKNNNAQQEYYLTDIIEIIKNGENINVELYDIQKEKQYEIMGINTPEQLIHLHNIFLENANNS
jgi:UDP-N-acetylglucosamine diphosphorylase/glucosamine-1-phosphate N-acetyltransferase